MSHISQQSILCRWGHLPGIPGPGVYAESVSGHHHSVVGWSSVWLLWVTHTIQLLKGKDQRAAQALECASSLGRRAGSIGCPGTGDPVSSAVSGSRDSQRGWSDAQGILDGAASGVPAPRWAEEGTPEGLAGWVGEAGDEHIQVSTCRDSSTPDVRTTTGYGQRPKEGPASLT